MRTKARPEAMSSKSYRSDGVALSRLEGGGKAKSRGSTPTKSRPRSASRGRSDSGPRSNGKSRTGTRGKAAAAVPRQPQLSDIELKLQQLQLDRSDLM